MASTRREFFKFVAMGVAAYIQDPELLLWQPGNKKIFIISPPTGVTMSEVIALEMERIIPRIRDLFERDDLFYQALKSSKNNIVATGGQMARIPLIVTDGDE
jgi:hypothetical protein